MFKRLLRLVLVGIAVIVVLTAANGYRTKQQLVGYCRETTGGTALATARETAARKGFRIIDSSADPQRRLLLVTASGVMGRVVCEVEHDGERVVKTMLRGHD